jgi:predicted ABC-type ATPase
VATFVNADEIARGLSGFAPEAVAVRAGRIMLERIAELTRGGFDFAFESTLAGLGVRDVLRRCREARYHVHLVYLWLPSAELALERVRQRVRAGGHDIPVADVRRRWGRSLVNILDHYIPLSSTWRLYDASAPLSAPAIARGVEGEPLTVLDPVRWTQVLKQADVIRRGGTLS